MIPAQFATFFVAATQASAALIGLLFVAISIAPERVFGAGAEATRKAMALSSFTALVNIFFVSFGSLIPDLTFGVIVLVSGLVALSQTLALLTLVGSWRHDGSLVRGITLFLVSAGLYLYESILGLQFLTGAPNNGRFTGAETLLLGIFAVGLARAWELLGAPQGRGMVGVLTSWLERRTGGKPRDRQEPPT